MSHSNPEQPNSELQIELKSDFRWFLSEEFQILREGYEPSDNREYLKQLKEKSPPSEGQEETASTFNNTVHGGKISFSNDDMDAERKTPPTQAENNEFPLMHKQNEKGLWHCTIFPGLKTVHLNVLLGQCALKDPDLKQHHQMMQKHSDGLKEAGPRPEAGSNQACQGEKETK